MIDITRIIILIGSGLFSFVVSVQLQFIEKICMSVVEYLPFEDETI